jgi:hypothetical protein
MEELDDYLLRTNRVVAFPSLKNRDYWKSETLELEGLCEFLKRIKEGED